MKIPSSISSGLPLCLGLFLAACGEPRSVRLGRDAMAASNYPSAIHYFSRALEWHPGLPNADEIRRLSSECYLALAEGAHSDAHELERLRADLALLAAENTRLKGELKKLRAETPPPPGATIPPAVARKAEKSARDKAASGKKDLPPATNAPSFVSYTVQPGDTLGGIARKHYGSSARWQDILDANRDKVKNARNLRAGTVLLIPD